MYTNIYVQIDLYKPHGIDGKTINRQDKFYRLNRVAETNPRDEVEIMKTENDENCGKNQTTQEKSHFSLGLFLSGVNTPVCVQLLINKPIFVIGKLDTCDGVLAFNDEISREHCKITWHDGQTCICDLNSTNGTALNGEMLAAGHEYPIGPKDMIRLASSTFEVEQIYSLVARNDS